MKFAIALTLLIFAGCATAPKPEIEASPRPAEPAPPPTPDLAALARALQMDRGKTQLGFEEKSFNPCEHQVVSNNCRPLFLTVVHFQLQCRDVDGTTENYQVEPITADRLKWSLGKIEGITETDREGYGQILAIAPSSQAQQRLRLTLNNDFLILKASETRRIVTPPDWCRRL